MSKDILLYSHKAKIRVIYKMVQPDSEPRHVVYRYKIQRRRRFLWWRYWLTEETTYNKHLARNIYQTLINETK